MVDIEVSGRRQPTRRPPRRLALMAGILAAGLLLAIGPGPLHAAGSDGSLEARLSQPQVPLGQSVELLLRYRPGTALPGTGPDLSALEADFHILDSRQVQRTSTVNGRSDSSLDWIVTLSPRRAGKVEIPALAVGGAQAEPLFLEVAERQAAAAGAGAAPVRLEMEVDRSDPYVQGQVVLTARILDSAGMTSATLTDPEIPGAVVERLGEDTSRTERRDGRDWRVFERRYAVFPQSSGMLEIPPLRLDAQLPAPRQSGSGPALPGFRGGMFPGSAFGGSDPFEQILARMRSQGFGNAFADPFFGRGTTRAQFLSEPISLQVRERPADAAGGWWLPALDVRLGEDWSGDTFRVGEPVTRRITLLARGATAAQLPDLALPPTDGLRQYVEDSARQDAVQDGDAVAARQILVSVVPGRAGEVVLPELRVPWWDIAAEEERVAVLPARVLQVAPAAGARAGLPPARVAPEGGASADPAGAGPAAEDGVQALAARIWPVAAGLLLLSLAVAAWLAHRHRHRLPVAGRVAGAGKKAAEAAEAAEAALARACAAGDGPAALAALAAWGRGRWPDAPPRGAGAVAERLGDADLRQAVQALTEALYGDGQADAAPGDLAGGQCDRLLAAFRRARHRRPVPAPAGGLPPLYPGSAQRATVQAG